MYLNSWFVSNFYTNTINAPPDVSSSSPKKKEIITTPDDYGFFCDIENMEPDETIEYTVVYHNRSDFYHVCRRIIRKSDNQTKIEIPQVRQYVVQMVKPTPTPTPTRSSHEKTPSISSSVSSIENNHEKKEGEQNKYRKCEVTLPSYYYYILYFLFISAAIITSLVIELDK